MAANRVIGVDLMGADVPPSHILQAALSLPEEFYFDTSLVFFGTQEVANSLQDSRFTYKVCPHVVTMDDNPLAIVREKKETSLLAGITALKEGAIHAFISCANTGALVALARTILELVPGILRPALACQIPVEGDSVIMLDVGANVEATPEMLVQFAQLGAKLSHAATPRVALLNIGQEAIKGREEHKRALELLEASQDGYLFVGNKEPHSVFLHEADVYVTDGFSGNLFLKSCEAATEHTLQEVQMRYPNLNLADLKHEGSGAQILGLTKLVVKCHGASSQKLLQNALIQTKIYLSV